MDPQLRPVFHATEHKDRVSVMYSARAPPIYSRVLACCGLLRMWCGCGDCSTFNSRQKLLDNTHVIVYENKLEYNNPYTTWCKGGNNYTTVYLDDPRFEQFEKASCCSPFCTHNSCCPTYCDSCGQGLVIYKRTPFTIRCLTCGNLCIPDWLGLCLTGKLCKDLPDPPNYANLSYSFPVNIAQQAGITMASNCCTRGCMQEYILIYPINDVDALIRALKTQRKFVEDYIASREDVNTKGVQTPLDDMTRD